MSFEQGIEGELVEFTAEDDKLLHGFLTGDESDTCFIYIHGMTGNFYSGELVKSLGKTVSENGYGFLAMNTRGHDEAAVIIDREGERDRGGSRFEKFEEAPLDIGGAIEALGERGYENFVLAGHSTGCQKAVYYQYERDDSSVKGIALLSPGDDYNLQRELEGWNDAVEKAGQMLEEDREDERAEEIPWELSAQRFNSLSDLERVESRIFNYEGEMREFSAIDLPIYVAFGGEDSFLLRSPEEYISILEENAEGEVTGSVMDDGGHALEGDESRVSEELVRWFENL